MCEVLSIMGGPIGLGGVLISSVTFQNGAHSFMLGMIMYLLLGLSMAQKMYIRDPRPLMMDSTIPMKDCNEMDFGNPSLHSFGITAMMFSSVYLYHRHYSATLKWDYKKSVITGLIAYNLALILVYFVAFSRVLKGVHSYNQIINGIMQGVFLTLLMIIFYEDLFMFYLDLKHTTFGQLLSSKVTMVFTAVLIAVLYTLLDALQNFQMPDQWRENLNKHCPQFEVPDPFVRSIS